MCRVDELLKLRTVDVLVVVVVLVVAVAATGVATFRAAGEEAATPARRAERSMLLV